MERRSWVNLPNPLRDAVEQITGRVFSVDHLDVGRNSAIVALLHTARGPVFCKGAPDRGRLAAAHRHEILVNRALPGEIAAPRLLWDLVMDDWLLAGYEYVPGEHADLTPGSVDVGPVVDAVSLLAERLTPSPVVADVGTLASKYARLAGWQWLADQHPAALTEWEKAHLDQLLEADLFIADAVAGDTLVHGDIHRLNILVDDGRARVIDWAGAHVGAPWADAALLAVRLIAAGHAPGHAEHVTASSWGMVRATDHDLTTFAAAVLGQWRRFGIEFPSPHRKAATDAVDAWARYRLSLS